MLLVHGQISKQLIRHYTTINKSIHVNPTDHQLSSIPPPTKNTTITFNGESTFPRLLRNNPQYNAAFTYSIYQHADLKDAYVALATHIQEQGYKEDDKFVNVKMSNDVELHRLRCIVRELLFKYDILKKYVKVDEKDAVAGNSSNRRIQLIRGVFNEAQKQYHQEHKDDKKEKKVAVEKKGMFMRMIDKLFYKQEGEK